MTAPYLTSVRIGHHLFPLQHAAVTTTRQCEQRATTRRVPARMCALHRAGSISIIKTVHGSRSGLSKQPAIPVPTRPDRGRRPSWPSPRRRCWTATSTLRWSLIRLSRRIRSATLPNLSSGKGENELRCGNLLAIKGVFNVIEMQHPASCLSDFANLRQAIEISAGK